MHSWTLAEIAKLTQSELKGDPTYCITGVADLRVAGPHHVSFFADPRYKEAAQKTQAGALFLRPADKDLFHGSILCTDNPKAAFTRFCELLFTTQAASRPKQGSIHPTAVISPSARIGEGTTIGPYVVIEEEVVIGAYSQIGAGCYLGYRVTLGEACHLFPRVTLLESSWIGNRVILQSGVVIGSLGFGYQTDAHGTHIFIPHFGHVIIEDDVEIGANSTIDRAQLGSTVIGQGTKIDNQVQIAHNVVVGPNNLFAAHSGIAGSSRTGKNVILAGKVGVTDHVELGDQVVISAFSAVSKSLKTGFYGGIPVMPFLLYKRNVIHARHLNDYVEKLNDIAERLLALEA